MLCLAYNAGLRASELVCVGLDDVRTPQLVEVQIMGKGDGASAPCRSGGTRPARSGSGLPTAPGFSTATRS